MVAVAATIATFGSDTLSSTTRSRIANTGIPFAPWRMAESNPGGAPPTIIFGGEACSVMRNGRMAWEASNVVTSAVAICYPRLTDVSVIVPGVAVVDIVAMA